MKKIKSLLKLIRIENTILAAIGVFLGSFFSDIDIFKNFYIVFSSSLSAFFITGFGNINNDIVDFQTDLKNKKNRPLITGDFSLKEAILLQYIFLILGFLVVWKWKYLLFISSSVSIILLGYNKIFKKLPIIGNIIVASLVSLTYIYGSLTSIYVNNMLKIDFIPIVFIFLINFIREVVKDIEDYYGDKELGYKTLPIVIGPNKTKIFLYVLYLIFIPLLFYPVFKGVYGRVYLFLMLMLVFLPFLHSLILLINARIKEDFHKISTLLKFIMIGGIFTLVFDKIIKL